jgi:hypothetical protein
MMHALSVAAILSNLAASTQLEVRGLLRTARRDLDAMFVGAWLVTVADQGDRLEYAGDHRAGPARIPIAESEVASFTTVVDSYQQSHEAVVCGGRLGRGMPRLVVAAVTPGMSGRLVLDAVEDLAWAIERVVVGR